MEPFVRYLPLVYLLLINLASFAVYGADKWKARHDRWRVPEKTLLLLALLLAGGVKDRHIRRTCGFFTGNMAFFFIPPCVGILDHWSTLSSVLLPFLLISILTTPLVYLVTAWVIQLAMRAQKGRAGHD